MFFAICRAQVGRGWFTGEESLLSCRVFVTQASLPVRTLVAVVELLCSCQQGGSQLAVKAQPKREPQFLRVRVHAVFSSDY